MLVFKKIRYKNFISTGNQWIEIDLNKAKTTILFGKNGSGKSTFTDAITYALYGKPFRKINKPQLINNYNKSGMVCEIEFSIWNKDYKVVRGQKPNIFEIYENGRLIDQNSSAYDYQDYLINNILKINYKSFVQIVVVGSATYIPFMELTPNDRRVVVEDLLNIDIISKMNIVLKRRLADHNITVNEVNRKYELTKEKLKIHDEYIKTNIQTLDENINSILQSIEGNDQNIKNKTNELNGLKDASNQINTQINALLPVIENNNKLLKAYSDMENKKKLLEKGKKFFEEESLCPKCGQTIREEYKTDVLSKKNTEIEKISQLMEEIDLSLKKMVPKVERHGVLTMENIRLASDIIKAESELKTLLQYKKKLEQDLAGAKRKKEEALQSMQENVNELKQELEQLRAAKDELLYKTELFDYSQTMLRDDGIKTKIIKYYLPTMNKLINKYLSYMNFKIGFQLNENFEEIITNLSKEGLSYENFSEGEKLRIDLAILFAWRELSKIKTNTTTNLLIMDEILDSSLDSEGISDFIKIIKQIIDDKINNVFIISHKDEQIIDKFHSAIRFDKPDGRFTRVTEIVN